MQLPPGTGCRRFPSAARVPAQRFSLPADNIKQIAPASIRYASEKGINRTPKKALPALS
jgi:hypothetical protein